MTAVRTERPIDNPVLPILRSGTLLTDVADELMLPALVQPAPQDGEMAPARDDRWRAGVRFVGFDPSNHPDVLSLDWCNADSLDDGSDADGGADAVFQAFSLWDAERCSLLGGGNLQIDWLNGRVDLRLRQVISYLLAFEAESGLASGSNPSLSDSATMVSGDAPPRAALSRLERMWAYSFGNLRADITMNPGVLSVLAEYLVRDGSSYRTASGHRIIADAGFGGTGPSGTPATADNSYMYASGPLAYKVSEPRVNPIEGSIEFAHNDYLARGTIEGLVVFDPDYVVGVEVDLTDTTVDV